MAVTYIEQTIGSSTLRLPVLHRAYYNFKFGDEYHIMRDWCKQNCKGRFYWAPTWAGYFVEFEDSADATVFALRWS